MTDLALDHLICNIDVLILGCKLDNVKAFAIRDLALDYNYFIGNVYVWGPDSLAEPGFTFQTEIEGLNPLDYNHLK